MHVVPSQRVETDGGGGNRAITGKRFGVCLQALLRLPSALHPTLQGLSSPQVMTMQTALCKPLCFAGPEVGFGPPQKKKEKREPKEKP